MYSDGTRTKAHLQSGTYIHVDIYVDIYIYIWIIYTYRYTHTYIMDNDG